MSYAAHAVDRFFARTGQPHGSALDGYYQFEMAILRDMLSRLEVILDDEQVPREVAERVIRCMLYGAPAPAAAEERMRRESEVVDLLSARPASIHITGIDPGALAALGLPPAG